MEVRNGHRNSTDLAKPDPEVTEKPKRRRFNAEYKLKILAEADACTEAGQLGALLRGEGLYSSHLSTWRRQRDAGALNGLEPKRRGRKPKPRDSADDELKRLRVENERLAERLRQAETIIEVQKKSPKCWEFRRTATRSDGCCRAARSGGWSPKSL